MTRRSDGRYQEELIVEIGGRSKRKWFYGKTKAEVLRKVAAYREEQETGRTFLSVSAEWWKEAEPTLAHNTAKSYHPALVRAQEHFGEWYVRKIRPADINRFMRDIIKTQHMADKTARTQLMIINLVCKYAVANGDIDYNPARDLTVPKGLKHDRREIASDDDIAKVKSCTDCTFGLFALWLLYTGLRRGELLALTWDDVDLDAGIITVNKSLYHVGNSPMVKEPKTAAGVRAVPIMSKLRPHIEPGKGPVFPDPAGGYMTSVHIRNMWSAYRQESGVSCTPHQLRHAYATLLFENNVQESDAQELLGHAQISTTKDIYTHIREQRKEKIRAQLVDADI